MFCSGGPGASRVACCQANRGLSVAGRGWGCPGMRNMVQLPGEGRTCATSRMAGTRILCNSVFLPPTHPPMSNLPPAHVWVLAPPARPPTALTIFDRQLTTANLPQWMNQHRLIPRPRRCSPLKSSLSTPNHLLLVMFLSTPPPPPSHPLATPLSRPQHPPEGGGLGAVEEGCLPRPGPQEPALP